MGPVRVVIILTLLLGIQPITTDLYLPALPSLTRDLATTAAAVQLTLSVLIIAFGLGQLVCGPLADRFGRRPVLLSGLALYTAASIFSTLAPSVEWLIFWRALQGAAMAAAVTCGRSIVRDLFAPHEGTRVMSRALTGLGVIAMLSPLVGGVLVQWLGWRAALSAPSVFGALTLMYVAWRFQETLPQTNPHAIRLGPMLRNWVQVSRHPTFQAWTILSALSYGGLFIMLAGSSFVYIDVLGTSRVEFGAILLTSSLAYTGGTFLCRHLLATRGLRRAAAIGGGLTLAGGLSMVGLSLGGVHAPWAIMVPQLLYAAGHGISQPCGQAGAIGPFPDKAGTAASLSGFAMSATALGAGLWIGHRIDGTVYPLTFGVAAFSVGVALVCWTMVQRHGDPRGASAASSP